MKSDSKLKPVMEYENLPDAELVYSFEEINTALDLLANTLNKHYAGKTPIILCVMNGALIFAGHLITRLTFQCELDYVHATRYRNTTQGNALKWLAYPNNSLKGRDVLILDDILDEGITLEAIQNYCYSEGAEQVDMAVLLHKNHNRCCINLDNNKVALQVDDHYVFGFGMDYEGQFRHLNAIYSLRDNDK